MYVGIAPPFFHKESIDCLYLFGVFVSSETTIISLYKEPPYSFLFLLEWDAFSCVRDLADPGIEPRTPTWQTDSLQSEPPEQRSPLQMLKCLYVD